MQSATPSEWHVFACLRESICLQHWARRSGSCAEKQDIHILFWPRGAILYRTAGDFKLQSSDENSFQQSFRPHRVADPRNFPVCHCHDAYGTLLYLCCTHQAHAKRSAARNAPFAVIINQKSRGNTSAFSFFECR